MELILPNEDDDGRLVMLVNFQGCDISNLTPQSSFPAVTIPPSWLVRRPHVQPAGRAAVSVPSFNRSPLKNGATGR